MWDSKAGIKIYCSSWFLKSFSVLFAFHCKSDRHMIEVLEKRRKINSYSSLVKHEQIFVGRPQSHYY